MLAVPVVEKLTVQLALESVTTIFVHVESGWPFMVKSTAPVGLPAPPLPAPIMALNLTGWNTVEGFGETTSLVVLPRLTVSSSKPDVLGA